MYKRQVQRKDRMRVGIHYFNDNSDIDRLVDYLQQHIEETGGNAE